MELSEYHKLYAKYKWEFLRRNPNYINDYKKLQEKLTENDYREPPNGQRNKQEHDLCKKWNIEYYIAPDISYDEFVQSFEDFQPDREHDPSYVTKFFGFDAEILMYETMYSEFIPSRPFTIIDGWDIEIVDDKFMREISDKVSENGNLTIEVDLNYSKNRLVKEFKNLINEWKILYEDAHKKYQYLKFREEKSEDSFEKYYKKALKKRKQKYEKKYHFDNFDLYLQVYDLRQKKMSWSKISTELNLNSVQTARNHYNAACELIEKGIDLYVK